MKPLFFRSMTAGGLCCLAGPMVAIAQTAPMPMRAVAGEAMAMAQPKSIEREGKVVRATATFYEVVDSAGKKYVLPIEPGASGPPANAKIKIKIWITLRPPGGGIEVSW